MFRKHSSLTKFVKKLTNGFKPNSVKEILAFNGSKVGIRSMTTYNQQKSQNQNENTNKNNGSRASYSNGTKFFLLHLELLEQLHFLELKLSLQKTKNPK